MKKIAKLLVATALVLSIVGCNKSGDSKVKRSKDAVYTASGESYSAEIDPATGKVYDFGGMEVVFYDWWTNPDAPAASTQDADQRAFRAWLQDTYNFKFVQKDLAGWGQHPQEVANICQTADTSKYEVMFVDFRSAIPGLQNGFWKDLSKLNIDWTKEKWSQGLINKLRDGDSFYCFGWGKPEPRNGVFFNKRILQENGIDPELPYDLQKENKWTWDTFRELCEQLTKDVDNDGITDQYAMASKNDIFGPASLDSNGEKIIALENGKFVNKAGTDNAFEAWNYTRDMFLTHQRPQAEGENWDYYFSAFTNGEVAFLVDEEYNAQPNGKFATMKDDYGFVCFPLGPKGKKYSTLHADNMLVIPAFYDDETANKIAKILDFISEPVPGYSDPDTWKEAYWASFRDERAVNETLQLMMDNPNQTINAMIPDLNVAEMSWNVCGGQDPVEAYEQFKDSWQSRLDAVNK